MSKILIDSHTLVWLLFEPERVGKKANEALLAAHTASVSLASLWELAIKYNKGKLVYAPQELLQGVSALGADLLHVQPQHILQLAEAKTQHKDPFDRMLLAQAQIENLTLVTADHELLALGLPFVIDVRK